MHSLKWITNGKEDYLRFENGLGIRYLAIKSEREILIVLVNQAAMEPCGSPPDAVPMAEAPFKEYECICEVSENGGYNPERMAERIRAVLGYDALREWAEGSIDALADGLNRQLIAA